jgi:hypothetical protein
LDSSAERGRLVITDRARDAIGYLCRAGGPQALVVAWPDGVAHLPVAMFSPSEFDVIITPRRVLPCLCRRASARLLR